MKTPRLALITLALSAPLLAFAAPSFLGGTPVETIADGEWNDGSIWEFGSPPLMANLETANVNHDVSVTTAGAEASNAWVGVNSPGSVTVSAGSLSVGELSIARGFGVPITPVDGAVTITGGSVTAVDTVIGWAGDATVTLSGGTFVTDDLHAGTGPLGGTATGTMTVEGNGAAITVNDQLRLSTQGSLRIRPTANGAAGLSTIAAGRVRFLGGGVELDVSAYTPAVGDSWDVFTYSVGVDNSAIVTAPPGYTVVEDQGTPGVITYTVTEVPVWADLGNGLAGVSGEPLLEGTGTLQPGSPITIALSDARPFATANLVVGYSAINLPFYCGTLVPGFAAPDGFFVVLFSDALGEFTIDDTWPGGVPSGFELFLQYWIDDPAAICGLSASNAVVATAP